MNLLIVNPYMAAGGTEERVKALAAEMRKHGHKTVFLVHGEPAQGRDDGEYVICHTTDNMSRLVASKMIEKYKIDLVQQHNYQNVGLGALEAARRAKIPSVYWAHDFCSICCRRFLIDGMLPDVKPCQIADPRKCRECTSPYNVYLLEREQELLSKATIGITPSNYFTTVLEAHGVLKGRWHKVTPWINPAYRDLFWSGYCNRTIMFAGNYTPGKGVHTLIHALPRIVKEIPDIQLRLLGTMGQARVVLEARKEKVADRIWLHPAVGTAEQMAIEYVNAGVVCFPTRLAEAFGLIWAEAMTVGAPVICSKIGSIPEYLTGRVPLVDPYKPEDWAEAILTIFQDRKATSEHAEEQKKWASEEFAVERAYSDVMKIYEGVNV